MTNADVIRKMSDMQLHRFLEDFRVDWFDTAAISEKYSADVQAVAAWNRRDGE